MLLLCLFWISLLPSRALTQSFDDLRVVFELSHSALSNIYHPFFDGLFFAISFSLDPRRCNFLILVLIYPLEEFLTIIRVIHYSAITRTLSLGQAAMVAILELQDLQLVDLLIFFIVHSDFQDFKDLKGFSFYLLLELPPKLNIILYISVFIF